MGAPTRPALRRWAAEPCHIQAVRVHPRFSPDGTQVLFTAGPDGYDGYDGYGNLALTDVPAFDSLSESPVP